MKKILRFLYMISLLMAKKVNVGGQAVIEGVMMKDQDKYAVAVRKIDKEIIIEKREYISYTKRYKVLGLPIIRGAVSFFESMVQGMKILTYSAEFFEVEEEENKSKFEEKLEKRFGEKKMQDILIGFSVITASIFSVGLFILLPAVLSDLLKPILGDPRLVNFTDGILRMVILLLYMLIISRVKDVQRVFEYHGAEHKSIHCLENEEPLTVENVKKQTRFHKRCGTNFIFIVVMISVIILTIINVETLWMRLVTRLLLLPFIAGISYEVLKGLGKGDNILTDIVSFPGLMLQRLTTSEPDDEQIEVAIAALNGVLHFDEEDSDDSTASR